MIDAVVFDMDGLLIDSEPLWVRAEIEIFGEVSVVLGEEDCAKTKGLRIDDVVAYWFQRRPWTTSTPADVEERLVSRVAELVASDGVAKPGIEVALGAARRHAKKLALASSSPHRLIRAALARLGLASTFDVVRSAETEPYGKPHPGIFLATAEELAVDPARCLVLEDSFTGVLAAKSARMACIAVPEVFPDHDPRFVIADAIVGSLADVSSALVERVAKGQL